MIGKLLCLIGLHNKIRDTKGCYGPELMPVALFDCARCGKQWIQPAFTRKPVPVRDGVKIKSGQTL